MNDAVRIFNAAAQLYRDKYWDVSVYTEGLDTFCAGLKQNAEVLELACGPGNLTRYLVDQRPDLRILATDLSEKMLEIASLEVPEAKTMALDSRYPDSLEKKFDGLVAGFILPYIAAADLSGWALSLSRTLNQGGMVYLSFMSGDPARSGPVAPSSGNGEALWTWIFDRMDVIQSFQIEGIELIWSVDLPAPPHYQNVMDTLMVFKKR